MDNECLWDLFHLGQVDPDDGDGEISEALPAQEYSSVKSIHCPKVRLTAEFNEQIHIPYNGAYTYNTKFW
jgi:hypothetical protein